MRNALNHTFSLLYNAAELLQVPSSKTKLRGSCCTPYIAKVNSLPSTNTYHQFKSQNTRLKKRNTHPLLKASIHGKIIKFKIIDRLGGCTLVWVQK